MPLFELQQRYGGTEGGQSAGPDFLVSQVLESLSQLGKSLFLHPEDHLVQICLIGPRAFLARILASLIPSNYKHAVSHWIPMNMILP